MDDFQKLKIKGGLKWIKGCKNEQRNFLNGLFYHKKIAHVQSRVFQLVINENYYYIITINIYEYSIPFQSTPGGRRKLVVPTHTTPSTGYRWCCHYSIPSLQYHVK